MLHLNETPREVDHRPEEVLVEGLGAYGWAMLLLVAVLALYTVANF